MRSSFERKLADSFQAQIVHYSCPADGSCSRISWRMQAGHALTQPVLFKIFCGVAVKTHEKFPDVISSSSFGI